MTPIALLADPADPRAWLFDQALRRRGHKLVRLIDYRDVLREPGSELDGLAPGTLLRIESPGRAPDINRALVQRGRASSDGSGHLEAMLRHPEFARMVYPPAWGAGLRSLLSAVGASSRERGIELMQASEDILLAFDKPACRARLAAARVAVPTALGHVTGFEALRAHLPSVRGRAFLKPRCGSSASGAVALETHGDQWQAFTTVEQVREGRRRLFFNSRRIQRVVGERQVADLVEALVAYDMHAEAWVPKASVGGGAADLRVLSVAGVVTHAVARVGRGPFTNLHLGGRRVPSDALTVRMGPSRYAELLRDCARVARVFDGLLHVGIDVAVTSCFRSHRVLEVNAFGDLLRGVGPSGYGTYDAELAALLGPPPERAPSEGASPC